MNYDNLASKVLSLALTVLDGNEYYKGLLDGVFQEKKVLNGWNLFKIRLKNGYKFTPGKELTILIIEENNNIFGMVIFGY